MDLEYRLIQFVEDPLRCEGKNFAVVVSDGEAAYLCALGLGDDGKVDLDYYRTLSDIRDDTWVFGEWIHWLQSLVRSEHPEKVFAALDSLENREGRVISTWAGILEAPGDQSIEAALKFLHERMIGRRGKPRVRFEDRVEDLLRVASIASRPDFEREIFVEFDEGPGKAPVVVNFPYALTQEPRTGFKLISSRGGIQGLVRQVNDALFTFEKAVQAGFLPGSRCVVLAEYGSNERTDHLERLADIVHVVDVSYPDAGDQLRHIVTRGLAA